MPETGDLRVSEAVALAHALVARLAELEGVRVLFIKGPTAVALGARPPRPSTDVDVLCEPGGLERLGPALERGRWRRRVPEGAGQELKYAARYLFEHSVHFIHDEWPCDLDIHYNFPGFLAPDDVAFEALWARRAMAEVARWPVPCANFICQAVIVGLHALRDPSGAHSQTDLDFLTGVLGDLPSGTLAELAELMAKTGCSETLQPLMARVGVTASSSGSDPEQLLRWKIGTENAGTYTMSWLFELRRTPWHRKPRLLWRAVFLSGDELLSQHVGRRSTRFTVAKLQLKRWRRAIRHLPRGVRAARRVDRELP